MSNVNSNRSGVLEHLDKHHIQFMLKEHPPLFTVADSQKFDAEIPGVQGTKNLFLRGTESGCYYLYVLPDTDRADLKQFALSMGEKKVTFGDTAALMEHLGITPGAVSLCCLLNDPTHRVRCVVDAKVLDAPVVSMHPNDNTATIALTQHNLMRFFESIQVTPVRI